MDPLRVLTELNGFFTRAEAREFGYDDRAVTSAVRARRWLRIRRGFYTFPDAWTALDEVGRHQVRSHAVLRSLGPAVALSHVSGAIEHGIDTWGVDLRRVHVTRLDGGAGRSEGDVVHHEGFCLDEDVVEVNGHLVLSPDRCAVEAASRASGDAGLVLLDSLLHKELASHDQLMTRFELMQHWPHTRPLHITVRMADGRAESPGESRGRHFFWSHHLPAPQLQFKVYDERGRLVGTTDWAWPECGLLGEFDGRVKYGRLLAPGQDPGEVVFAEKQREDLLREVTGFAMIRLIWADYERPRLTVSRIDRLLRRAA